MSRFTKGKDLSELTAEHKYVRAYLEREDNIPELDTYISVIHDLITSELDLFRLDEFENYFEDEHNYNFVYSIYTAMGYVIVSLDPSAPESQFHWVVDIMSVNIKDLLENYKYLLKYARHRSIEFVRALLAMKFI